MLIVVGVVMLVAGLTIYQFSEDKTYLELFSGTIGLLGAAVVVLGVLMATAPNV